MEQAQVIARTKSMEEEQRRLARKIRVVDATQARVLDKRDRHHVSERGTDQQKAKAPAHSLEFLKFLKSVGR